MVLFRLQMPKVLPRWEFIAIYIPGAVCVVVCIAITAFPGTVSLHPCGIALVGTWTGKRVVKLQTLGLAVQRITFNGLGLQTHFRLVTNVPLQKHHLISSPSLPQPRKPKYVQNYVPRGQGAQTGCAGAKWRGRTLEGQQMSHGVASSIDTRLPCTTHPTGHNA